jgi:hypothetical protein
MMNATKNASLVPLITLAVVFLVLYSTGVIYLFARTINGCRRRWQALDFIWVPIGGVTGVLILALWWKSR